MKPIQLVGGSDGALRGDKRRELIKQALGDDDASLALSEFIIPQTDSGEHSKAQVLGSALDAASHPPFGTAHRVVAISGLEHLRAGDIGPLVTYLENPMTSSIVVLDLGPGRKPPALAKALKAGHIEVHEVEKDGGSQLKLLLDDAGVSLDARATKAIMDRFGDNLGALSGLVSLLSSTYGPNSRLGEGEVASFLVESGSVPPYLLSNAIESGNLGESLRLMDRLMTVGGMHPLPLVALLHNHYRQALLVDDPAVRTDADAVTALGGKVKAFPAKKARARARALGTVGLRIVFGWLDEADQSLRGASGAPADIVMTQLVTRLARYHRDLNRPDPSVAGRRR